ncbi:MAG TPA: hypothetical protein ENJ44_05105 [Oceanospirillales bacterium]|nr:hypothetical protein [Oceanospirillales bacterium]
MIIMRNDSKNAYFKDFNSMEKFCASRGSDSISVSQQEFQLGVSALDKSDNIGEESGSGAIALGGRSPTVLITRELMYRACELTLNINADNDKTLEIYKIFLDYVLKIVKNEHDIGSNTNSAIMSNNSGNQDEDSDDY